MNQEQIKQKLLELKSPVADFQVILSGKASKKVDGLYKIKSQEIILHNKNFNNDNELIYTAIHEFAHHLQFTESALPISGRAHTVQFWAIFHELLGKAEEKGSYESPLVNDPEFIGLTRKLKQEILSENGKLMKECGSLLLRAMQLCEKHHLIFEDYLNRILNLPRASAQPIIRAHAWNMDPQVGFENMRLLARIPEKEKRDAAQAALLQGQSSDSVKHTYLSRPQPEDSLQVLAREKDRLERMIATLKERLSEIEKRIGSQKQTSPEST